MLLLHPTHFKDYELIDCGDFEKLERFGKYITIRPEPQAVWSKKLTVKEWESKAHVKFKAHSSSAGTWQKLKDMPDQWAMEYQVKNTENLSDINTIKFRLGLTSFKHVGIFPEQAANWDFIYSSCKKISTKPTKVLNLFAYTGGASLAANAAGAKVTHVDSIKQVVSWANENMQLSGQTDIRWVVEDALKFVKREQKRGNKYHGIILDPPAFGHGPNGEKWKLEEQLNEMVNTVLSLLEEQHFLVLNAYSLGLSSIILENLLIAHASEKLQTGELFLPSTSGLKLPLGVFGRFLNL